MSEYKPKTYYRVQARVHRDFRDVRLTYSNSTDTSLFFNTALRVYDNDAKLGVDQSSSIRFHDGAWWNGDGVPRQAVMEFFLVLFELSFEQIEASEYRGEDEAHEHNGRGPVLKYVGKKHWIDA